MYLLLAILIVRVNKLNLQAIIWLSIAGIYGIGIEATQHLLPGRFFSIADIIANCLGLGLGYLLIKRSLRY